MKKIFLMLLLTTSLVAQALENQDENRQMFEKLPLGVSNEVKLVDIDSINDDKGDVKIKRYLQLSVKNNELKVQECNDNNECNTTHQIDIIEVNKLIDVYNEATKGPPGQVFAFPTIPIVFGVGLGLCGLIKKCGAPGFKGSAISFGTTLVGFTTGIGAYIGLQILFAEDASVLDHVHLGRMIIPTEDGELELMKVRNLNYVLTSFTDLELYIDEHVE